MRLVSGLLICLCATAVAQSPRVLSSEPAHLSRNIPVDVGVVRIVFDRDMDTGAWTLWRSPQGEFPPQRGANDRPWKNARTFELALGRLQPGKTYALQLNSPQKQRFRAADGTPLPITTIAFATGPGGAAPAGTIVGTWVRDDPQRGKLQLGLAADFTFARLITTPDGRESLDRGSWSFQGGLLEMRPKNGNPERYRARLDGDSILVLGAPPQEVRLQRKGRLPARAAGNSIVGSWKARSGDIDVELVFADGGNCVRTLRRGGQVVQRQEAVYRLRGATLEVTPAGAIMPIEWKLRFFDRNTLDITDEENRTTRYLRAGTERQPRRQPQPPKKTEPQKTPKPQPKYSGLSRHPTGTILYIRYSDGPAKQLIARLHYMHGDGSDSQELYKPDKEVHFATPWWSPDGETMLYSASFEYARSVFAMDAWAWRDRGRAPPDRITGNSRYANSGRGVGSILLRGKNNASGAAVPKKYFVGWQGLGQVGSYKDLGPDKGLISGLPAGRYWVKIFVNKHLGGWRAVDVAEGQRSVVTIPYADGNLYATRPSITPDGRYMVIMHQRAYWQNGSEPPPPQKPAPGKATGDDTVAVVDMTSGELVAGWQPAKMGYKFAKDPKLSPDGKWIVFTLGLPPSESIAVMSLQSLLKNDPQFRVVIKGEQIWGGQGGFGHGGASWSPDGRRIVFTKVRSFGDASFFGNLFVANADGSGARQVTQCAESQCPVYASFSPDGRRIATQLITSRSGGRLRLQDILLAKFTSDIWTIGVDGRDPKQLTKDGRSADPAWGP